MHQAKSRLSELVARVEKGEEIIIAKNGKPVAVLSGYMPPVQERKGGQWEGKIWMSEDFDEFGPDMEEMFGFDKD